MTTEQKFNAAVNVIRSLPKNGSYQPSNDLMLKFYGLFKQATEGPCDGPRPAFWNVIGRAKYDAWKKLGDMPKIKAMQSYCDGLHEIVETMSYSDNVANFLEAPTDDLSGLNIDDIELVFGDVIERVRSKPNSPFASHKNSPFGSREASPTRVGSHSATPPVILSDTDHSDDEYTDTIETMDRPVVNHVVRQGRKDISNEISKTVESLKLDVDRLTNQISALEKKSGIMQRKGGFFANLSPTFVTFIIIWPFVAQYVMNRYLVKRN